MDGYDLPPYEGIPGQAHPPTAPAPSAHPPAPPPPGSHSPGPASAPKRGKGAIIAIVIVVLLLCCCIGGGGVATWIYVASQDTDTGGQDTSGSNMDPYPVTDERLEAWATFESEPGELETVPADERQERIAEEVAAILLPGFSVDEARVRPGGFDEKTDGYIADYYIVSATLAADPSAIVAIEFWAQAEDAVGSAEGWTDADDGDTAAKLADGTEFVYETDILTALRGADADPYLDLLSTVERDWPGATVSWMETDDSSARVWITTWEQYSTEASLNGFTADYELGDATWSLTDWERADSRN